MTATLIFTAPFYMKNIELFDLSFHGEPKPEISKSILVNNVFGWEVLNWNIHKGYWVDANAEENCVDIWKYAYLYDGYQI